ncbi:superoxide dismutase [Ancylomarina euxinus]|uniref:Superoxide dismutase n=1 Tax=Ancylomarina euxinus TaxID=2283627 RepID=A0A425XXZ5_9BACT|nr:superoxide dismutase [Ancylomarina euxinus]MCZ4695877.1 superoxide dismutase [Ancylomarina euxinus]MUP16252.1 superoxide dismutase [Ancylomarina euxinus]RRG19624.1 superoxide dismutase [Ancylomarina euxinus]
MKHELPKLPYALNALEPLISQRTLEFHYGKHHQAYVNNLNNLIEGTSFENADLVDIILKSDGGIFNNAAQVFNHTFYFMALKPRGGGKPRNKLYDALVYTFGTFEKFKEEFSKAGATLFGSGWVWLVADANNKLSIVKTSNAANPLCDNLTPIMTLDVWEHAYYLDTQNARPKYIENFWELIDWELIETRFENL